jgi:hypothetical protein
VAEDDDEEGPRLETSPTRETMREVSTSEWLNLQDVPRLHVAFVANDLQIDHLRAYEGSVRDMIAARTTSFQVEDYGSYNCDRIAGKLTSKRGRWWKCSRKSVVADLESGTASAHTTPAVSY